MKVKKTDTLLTSLGNAKKGDVFKRDIRGDYDLSWGHYFIRTNQCRIRQYNPDGSPDLECGAVDLETGEECFFWSSTKVFLYPLARCVIEVQ